MINRLRGRSALVDFSLPLIPWPLTLWSQLEHFNQKPLPGTRATEQVYMQLEQALEGPNRRVWPSDHLPVVHHYDVGAQRTAVVPAQ